MENVNKGHRERLRNRMISQGLDGFQDHEVLELLLFQYLPRKDTNKLAHALLNKFGSFANVLDASPKQLMTVKGISQTTACNIAVLKEVFLRYHQSSGEKFSLSKLSSIVQYSQKLISESYVEKLVAVYVDNATNFLCKEEFCSNNRQAVHLDIKEIVSTAVSCNAAGVIIFHCHVDGLCLPSEADKIFTEKLFVTLANMKIVLLDHFIFNNTDEYYSFFKENCMDEYAAKYSKSINSKN